ncbi:cyclic AMP-dependent transcription factor ATF-6 beta, partial [Asbolus verrucosus]
YTDLPSDEDFLQQLSSDLDIPLLLNPGEDELSLLNAFFDKSPEEIMSEIALPSLQNDETTKLDMWNWNSDTLSNLQSEVKSEPSDSCSSSASNKSNSPVQSPGDGVKYFEIKDEMKSEPQSPGSIKSIPVHTEPESNILIVPRNPLKIPQNGKIAKTANKRVPIQPKSPYNGAKNKVVVFNNPDFKLGASAITNPPPPKVVVLENVSAVPITSVAQITPTTISNPITNKCSISPVILKRSTNLPLNVTNIDPKILKRQQRKIKNRESACLSRKKKKDYLTSLENQVKDLTTENQKLRLQNLQLQERLLKYEGNHVQKPSNVKTNIVLCMFLFSVAFNLDYIRNPFISRSQVNVIEPNTPKVMDHHGRNLLWASDDLLDKNSSNFLPFSMCPAAINQTESARLVLELERWIGKPKDLVEKPPSADLTKFSVSNYKSKSLRKKKQKKYQSPLISPMYSVSKKLPHVESNNELQVFSPSPEQLYSEFFEAINRQDDTFYVVSFSDHHMLLPALHHNKTRRPKMSLIMPSMLSNSNISQPALVPLMQIDCEVLDTKLIQVRYGSIPQHLRRHDNSTTYQNNEDVSKSSDSAANYTHKKAYKPYFIKQKSVRPSDDPDFYNIR